MGCGEFFGDFSPNVWRFCSRSSAILQLIFGDFPLVFGYSSPMCEGVHMSRLSNLLPLTNHCSCPGDARYSFPLQKPLSPTPPRPHPTPRNGPETDPKQTRNGAKRSQTEPKRSQTEPKWTEIKLFGVGRAGGLSG